MSFSESFSINELENPVEQDKRNFIKVRFPFLKLKEGIENDENKNELKVNKNECMSTVLEYDICEELLDEDKVLSSNKISCVSLNKKIIEQVYLEASLGGVNIHIPFLVVNSLNVGRFWVVILSKRKIITDFSKQQICFEN